MKLTKALIEQYLKIKKMQQTLNKKQAQIKELLMQKKKSKFAVDNYEITIKAFKSFVEAHERKGHLIKIKSESRYMNNSIYKNCIHCHKLYLSIPEAAKIKNNGDELDGAYFNCSCKTTLFIPLYELAQKAGFNEDQGLLDRIKGSFID